MTEEWSLSLVVFEAPLADLGLLAFSKTLTQTGGAGGGGCTSAVTLMLPDTSTQKTSRESSRFW